MGTEEADYIVTGVADGLEYPDPLTGEFPGLIMEGNNNSIAAGGGDDYIDVWLSGVRGYTRVSAGEGDDIVDIYAPGEGEIKVYVEKTGNVVGVAYGEKVIIL